MNKELINKMLACHKQGSGGPDRQGGPQKQLIKARAERAMNADPRDPSRSACQCQ